MNAVLRSLRLASLLTQLAEEDGAYGAKSRAARRLGLSQGYASKIAAGLRTNVSDEILQRAAKALGLREEYFDAPGPAELDYHGFIGEPSVGAWDDWVASLGTIATEDERKVLLAMAAAAEDHGESVTPALLSGLLIALRTSRTAAAR